MGSISSPLFPRCKSGCKGYNSREDRKHVFFTSLFLLFYLFFKHFLLWVSTNSLRVGSEGPKSCQHFSSRKKLVQKASCYPEGCDRWQDHCAECGRLTHVERWAPGSWKQSSGNYSWPASASHIDNSTPF